MRLFLFHSISNFVDGSLAINNRTLCHTMKIILENYEDDYVGEIFN